MSSIRGKALPPHFRSSNVIAQALSAFLANLIYKQFPESPELGHQMIDAIVKLVKMQIK
ncbi:hypothetical protein [Legionella tucsonensis]|uniref:Uncharacterized protein n=1 Tax=Legionella tucsonensis TaxID=40335 RepID=A0A0W0ZPU2_9GAMM|nr:hypothetical protein [Legionella tucsonensis]KTD71244.1 hypothetical protein Ltuc_2603 [Legionella tucsonensis]